MIEFEINKDLLILKYLSTPDNQWIIDGLNNDEKVVVKHVFHFDKHDLYDSRVIEEEDPETPLEFVFGRLSNNGYIKIDGRILNIDISVFIDGTITPSMDYFKAVKNISVFGKLAKIARQDIFIGGGNPTAIPKSEFKRLIKNFPNTYELQKYAEARVSTVMKNYLDSFIDAEEKYENYMNKKVSEKGTDLLERYRYSELEKYKSILHKLEKMLESENSYNERQWQTEVLQIIRLLYPKYICAFEEAPVRDTYNNKNKKIDLLLVDSSGNTDILEIKKPFDNCIVTKGMYRDNYIPLKELSGTVMQIEKYIFYLNKWGRKGEEVLTEKYRKRLPANFSIKIINPTGIIVMGRDSNLSSAQKEDFEVVKRKYKNVMDIITYDDLLGRLRFTIDQFQKT
jgi:hypothetical protein